MEKFYLKKFTPVYKSGDKICIGYAQHNNYVEIDFIDSNYEMVNKAIIEGLHQEEIKNDKLYSLLNQFEFLEVKSSYEEITNIKREELYFQYLENENFNEETLNTKILIFGAGAAGSTIIYMLAQIGFNNLIVIDDDVVTKTDITKSIAFRPSQEGVLKVEALQETILDNFNIKLNIVKSRFISFQEIEDIFDLYNPEFVVKACDPKLVFRLNLNKSCFKRKIPFTMMAYSFQFLRLGPLYIPGFTSCDESINKMMKQAYGNHYDFESDKKLFTDSLVHPAISFNVNIMSSFTLKEILMYLTKQYEYCFTIGRLIEFNPLSLGHRSLEVHCENCSTCKI